MSASPASPPPPRGKTRGHLLRFVLAFVLLIAAAALVAGAVALWMARAALPQLEGELRLPGLSQPVEVVRDIHGVPHITAAGLDDLFFAQGFVTAQDRLWQMDMTRRSAAGELAEVLGPDLLPQDRRSRILRFRHTAELGVAALPELERGYLEAYARGVNAYLEGQRHLPIEFRILRYRPAPWTPRDSLLVAAYMADGLAGGLMQTELGREMVLEKLGPELTADLYPTSSWRDRVPGEPAGGAPQPAPRHAGRPARALPRPLTSLLPEHELAPPVAGSNNWVVSGAHTAGGRPLLSNDMHLGHQMPGVWYRAHLRSGSLDVSGFTLPGTPFVIVGHNQRIAWGFTNIGPDVQDLFIESFNGNGEYLTPQGWRQPERYEEVIRVRRQPDVTLQVEVTRNGPIVTPLLAGETRKLALRWTLYESGVMDIPFLAVNQAQDWDEFRRAFARFAVPGQNVVYADVDGNIGYQATGRIPIRGGGGASRAANAGPSLPPADGTYPVPGHDERYQWTGYVPFDELPRVFNPPSGILATANGRITPAGYPHHLAAQWASPYRTERIYRVLESGKKFTSADMLALQMDIYAALDHLLAERFVAAVEQAPAASPRARQAADLMRGWDGRQTVESTAAPVARVARERLARLLLQAKLGEDWRRYRWFMSSVWLEDVVTNQPARWLPEEYKDYGALLVAAVDAAVSDQRAPRDLAQWRWGHAFPVELQHSLLGRLPLLGRWSAPGVQPQAGSGDTVKAAGRRFGASQRMTVDLGDLDATTMNIVTGQSGQVLSRHYLDHWPAWHGGTTFRAPFSAAAVEGSRRHTLILRPNP